MREPIVSSFPLLRLPFADTAPREGDAREDFGGGGVVPTLPRPERYRGSRNKARVKPSLFLIRYKNVSGALYT